MTARTLIMCCATAVKNTVPRCDGRQWLHQQTVRHLEHAYQALIRQQLIIFFDHDILTVIIDMYVARIYLGKDCKEYLY